MVCACALSFCSVERFVLYKNCPLLLFLSDEKEKYDPNSFRDAIIQGLNETEGDLEKV